MVPTALVADVERLGSEEDDVNGGEGGGMGGDITTGLSCHALRGIPWLVEENFCERFLLLRWKWGLGASRVWVEDEVLSNEDLGDSSTSILCTRGDEGVRRAPKA